MGTTPNHLTSGKLKIPSQHAISIPEDLLKKRVATGISIMVWEKYVLKKN